MGATRIRRGASCKWRLLAAAGSLVGVLAGASQAAVASAGGDRWSPQGVFRTAEGWYAAPIHANVLPDGRVLFIGIARATNPATPASGARRVSWIFTPPPPGTDPSPEVTIDEIAEPVEHTGTNFEGLSVYDDLYCTTTVLDDTGRLHTAGGTRIVSRLSDGVLQYTLGLPYQTMFDGSAWRRLPGEMVGKGPLGTSGRWYATLSRLPDKRLLVTGGLELITPDSSGVPNRTLETLDPQTGQRALVSAAASTPEAIHARDYPHVFVLPVATPHDVLVVADAGLPQVTAAQRGAPWLALPRRPTHGVTTQPNWGAASVMLPIRVGPAPYRNGSIMVAGGDMVGSYQRTADMLDPYTGAWSPSVDLGIDRHHPAAVLLPDSRVLLAAGHDMNGGTGVQQAQYVDPLQDFLVTTSGQLSGVTRGYHTVAVLLRDGRVLVAGGRDTATGDSLEKPTYQLFSPDYLSRPRPLIGDSPAAMQYGSLMQLTTVGRPSEVVLVGLGSMTHSFDNNQRVVELPIGQTYERDDGAALSIVGTPVNAHIAPPGYYQLIVLDSARTPSEAQIVRLG